MKQKTIVLKIITLFLLLGYNYLFSQTTTWNGSSWIPIVPDISTDVIFDASYSSSGNIVCKKVIVNSGANVVFNSGHMLTIQNEVIVNGGTLTFENDASLVQINPNSVNIGSIIYKRDTNPARNVDYTYWTSPVSNQVLGEIFLPNEFPNWYSYIYWNAAYLPPWNPEAHIAGTWIGINNTPTANNHFTEIMEVGKGYAFQAPSSYTTPGIQHIRFTGVPNNGTITKQVLGSPFLPVSNNLPCEYSPSYANFVGNPYPSALDADSFLKDPANNSTIYGTLGFYTHGSLPGNFNEGFDNYTARDFALYNRLGGVGTSKLNYNLPISSSNSNRPTGRIASGQGFFVNTNTNTTITFKNDMRVDGSVVGDSNGEFYRIGTTQNRIAPMERHRIWFSIENTNVSINPRRYYESMVGYCPEATNIGADKDFDHVMTVPEIDLQIYSLKSINDICEPLTIQGRLLSSFNTNNVIPLGFIAKVSGASNTFKIEAFGDGMFSTGGQKYYLRDNEAGGLIWDIENNPYTFSLSADVTNNTRFEIIFLRLTQLISSQCNGSINTLGTQVYANLISGATGYIWQVTNSAGVVHTFTTTMNTFNFTNSFLNFPNNFVLYNETYSIQVAAILPNITPVFGPICTLTTPNPVVQVNPVLCNNFLSTLGTQIDITGIEGNPHTAGYIITMVNLSTNVSFTFPISWNPGAFDLTNLAIGYPANFIQYNTPYSISVSLINFNSSVLPSLAQPCIITTPNPVVQVNPSFCNSVLPTLGTQITFTGFPQPNTQGYMITMINLATNVAFTFPVSSNPGSFNLANQSIGFPVNFVLLNTQYSISVSLINFDGSVLPSLAQPCIITTPPLPLTQLTSDFCNNYIVPKRNTQIFANIISGVVGYEWEIQNMSTFEIRNFETPLRVFRFNNPILASGTFVTPNTQYCIRVRGIIVYANGSTPAVYGDYGSTCCLTTASPFPASKLNSDFNGSKDILFYPNPFTTNFTLDLSSIVSNKISVKVYDILGKLIDNQEIDISELKTVSLGDNYNSGIYNVVIFDGDKVKTVRVIKN